MALALEPCRTLAHGKKLSKGKIIKIHLPDIMQVPRHVACP
jgi:hypothetical protein